jgi:hypothetical protein
MTAIIAFLYAYLWCQHRRLAWVRNIHGDEINLCGQRTLWCCEDCGRLIGTSDYTPKEKAAHIYEHKGTP